MFAIFYFIVYLGTTWVNARVHSNLSCKCCTLNMAIKLYYYYYVWLKLWSCMFAKCMTRLPDFCYFSGSVWWTSTTRHLSPFLYLTVVLLDCFGHLAQSNSLVSVCNLLWLPIQRALLVTGLVLYLPVVYLDCLFKRHNQPPVLCLSVFNVDCFVKLLVTEFMSNCMSVIIAKNLTPMSGYLYL